MKEALESHNYPSPKKAWHFLFHLYYNDQNFAYYPHNNQFFICKIALKCSERIKQFPIQSETQSAFTLTQIIIIFQSKELLSANHKAFSLIYLFEIDYDINSITKIYLNIELYCRQQLL